MPDVTTIPESPSRGDKDFIWFPYQLERVLILGMGPSGADFVQHQYHHMFKSGRPESEIWTVNSGASAFQHDVVFNMHELPGEDRHKFLEFYKRHDKPLITLEHLEEVPLSYEYPLDLVAQAFGEAYFTNAVAYMIAFAMLCGVKRLDMFGCDYHSRQQYEDGRCCVEYWLGRAKSSGVNVQVGQTSTLMDVQHRAKAAPAGACYGYGDRQPIFGFDQSGQTRVVGWQQGGAKFEDVEASIEAVQVPVKCRKPTATEVIEVTAEPVSK